VLPLRHIGVAYRGVNVLPRHRLHPSISLANATIRPGPNPNLRLQFLE
jgi:hypothetical protein